MKPIKLTAVQEDRERLIPPSLVAHTLNGIFFCTIYADNNVGFNVERDYSTEDLQQIVQIQDQFFTIFNSLIEKDSEIEVLKEKNKALIKELMLSLNPVNERQ